MTRPDFTPGKHNEKMHGELEKWSEDNYARLPEIVRKDCEREIWERMSANAEGRTMLVSWRDQRRRGVVIGSDDLWFHMGAGMWVRNALRQQWTDAELPVVTSAPDGQPYGPAQNWDDYYFGALAAVADAMIAEEDARGKDKI